ncbi:MAG TPA: ATP-binding protein [Actinomycetales bacterium]|nr:ATP-binding protein [Actinomycetales bacterium]
MATSTPWRILLVLALVATAGGMSVASAPDGTHIGQMWPVGLATGVLLLTPLRSIPISVAALFLVATGTFLLGGYPSDTALGYGFVTVLEAWLVQRLLPRRPDGNAWLLRNDEFLAYTLACVAGAVTGGTGFALISASTAFGTAWQVGVAAFATHLASQLILVPLFLRVPPLVLPQGRREQLVRWLLALGVTTAAFTPSQMPSLVFLVMPVLAWTAVRAPMRETHYQLLSVASIASIATALGSGPFDEFVNSGRLSTELARVPQQAFLLSCVLVSIPFAIAVRQQRESQRQAATEKSRSDRLVNSAHGLVIVGTDDLGRINVFNPGAEQVLGYAATDVFGESPEIFHRDAEIARLAGLLGCKPDFYSVIGAYLEQNAGVPMDWEFVRKDGERRILSFTLSSVSDEQGEVVGFIATADDVTERVRVRQALEESLHLAVEAERSAVERLSEVDRAKDSFVSAVSHELRTPITSLLGYLEMLQDGSYGPVPPAHETPLDRIGLNSRRLLSLIDDVLALARVDQLELDVHRVPTDLAAIVRAVGTDLRHLGETRGLAVDVDVPEHPVLIPGDTDQLNRMVTSLADNAAKFTPDGGRVTLRLAPAGASWALVVQDTGAGIPPHEQARVFERFFRSSAADHDAVAGTGIGLFMAKAIAEAHGATVELSSEPGLGTTLQVVFVDVPVAPLAT